MVLDDGLLPQPPMANGLWPRACLVFVRQFDFSCRHRGDHSSGWQLALPVGLISVHCVIVAIRDSTAAGVFLSYPIYLVSAQVAV